MKCQRKVVCKKFLGIFKYHKKIQSGCKYELVNMGRLSNIIKGDCYKVKFKCTTCGHEEIVEMATKGWLMSIGVPEKIIDNFKDCLFYHVEVYKPFNFLIERVVVDIND